MIVALIFFIKLLTLSISIVAVLRRMETEAVVTAQDKGKIFPGKIKGNYFTKATR